MPLFTAEKFRNIYELQTKQFIGNIGRIIDHMHFQTDSKNRTITTQFISNY